MEVQFRKSSTCQLCKTKYRYVEVRRTKSNSLLAYITSNVLRALATVLYFLAIPLLTTLWFCNKMLFCQEGSIAEVHEQSWSNMSLMVRKYGDHTRIAVTNSDNRSDNDQRYQSFQSSTHPLVALVFAYHLDVVWINVANLLLIQMIMNNLEHYHEWCIEHRPRIAIHLT